jgi:uncharacterized protein YodC (DUF2158 family)
MEELEVGTIVRLKSGGPSMTITGVNKACIETMYICAWFTGKGKCKRNVFTEGSIEVVSL